MLRKLQSRLGTRISPAGSAVDLPLENNPLPMRRDVVARNELHQRYLAAATVVMAAVLAGPGARAENWVQATQRNHIGFAGCVDLDSVRSDADGFTYYRSKICDLDSKFDNKQKAVRCSEISEGNVKVYDYWEIDNSWEPYVTNESSVAGGTALFICRQHR